LSNALPIPILNELVNEGFEYSQLLLVVYEPDSLWYDASLTIAARGVKDGIRIEYHSYEHVPSKIREAFTALGLNVKKLEEEDRLRILDSYTVQTGLGSPEKPSKSKIATQPLKLSDSSIEFAQQIKAGIPEMDRRWLHIDDNWGVMLQYNDEKAILNFSRTRMPLWVSARETTFIIAMMTGIASEAFYKQFVAAYDGIIDFRSEEKSGQVEQLVRVRLMRRKKYDSRWHKLRLLDNGEVALAD
jgi:KaiC/GvpD/RAD55 family RecA-like ATPase